MEQPLQDYRMEQTQFSKKLREQVRRRYEISHPEATEAEVSQGVENVIEGGEQLFAVCYFELIVIFLFYTDKTEI